MERPDRSDVHLLPEEEAKREEEAREFFDGIAPKRHSKPMRSEYSTLYQDALAGDDVDHGPIPELSKFEQLENQSMDNLVYTTSEAGEEFVETEYYKDLSCIEKQHHTTGSGFIKTEKGNSNGFSLAQDESVATDSHPSCRGNPATNEWIPAADTVISASGKASAERQLIAVESSSAASNVTKY